MQKNLKKLYYSTKPGGYIRRFLIQTHLIFLCLFNTLLHIMPFEFWKRFLCSLAGIKLCKGSTLCSGVRFLAFGKCIIGEIHKKNLCFSFCLACFLSPRRFSGPCSLFLRPPRPLSLGPPRPLFFLACYPSP